MIEYFKELDNYLKSKKERNKTICLIEIIKKIANVIPNKSSIYCTVLGKKIQNT